MKSNMMNTDEKIRRVYVPIGLPGAGKTAYFNKLRKFNVKRINMNNFKNKQLDQVLDHVLCTNGNLYLDGAFLSKNDQNLIKEKVENDLSKVVFLCLASDSETSETIKLANVNVPDECIRIR